MDKRGLTVLLGFLLFLFGMLSLILLLVGLKLSFLVWIDYWGMAMGMVIRLVMIFGGVIIMYMRSSRNA